MEVPLWLLSEWSNLIEEDIFQWPTPLLRPYLFFQKAFIVFIIMAKWYYRRLEKLFCRWQGIHPVMSTTNISILYQWLPQLLYRDNSVTMAVYDGIIRIVFPVSLIASFVNFLKQTIISFYPWPLIDFFSLISKQGLDRMKEEACFNEPRQTV